MHAHKNTVGHKKLYRSRSHKVLAGVCGGLAEYFDVDPSVIRIIWIILTAMTGVAPGILAYAIAALVIPQEPDEGH
jgi:phage shock protein C